MKVLHFLISHILSSTELIIVSTFLTVILIGSILLSMPFCNNSQISYIDSLFTSTSAVCVTGLIVRDTGSDFNKAGQVIILILIQLGGLGVMTFFSLIFFLTGKRITITSKYALYNSFFQNETAYNIKKLIISIFLLTLFIESLGTALLYMKLGNLFTSIFHSISAFCNAGFSLYSDSLIGFNTDLPVLILMMVLIFLGGIGYIVYYDLFKLIQAKIRNIRQVYILPVHTKVVLFTSIFLIIFGLIFLMLFGIEMDEPFHIKAVNALFQSVTARTAGFNSIDTSGLPSSSLFLLSVLMFIGGSPGSCAGGIKTSVFFGLLAYIFAMLKGRTSVNIFNRSISSDIINKIVLLVLVALLWNIAGFMILSSMEGSNDSVRAIDIIFEQISAFGTVGLSTGITSRLSAVSKIWIIMTMFFGRIGPLTIAFVIIKKEQDLYRMPREDILVG